MQCIICLKESPESDEHVFPDALGGNLIITRVCKSCNSWLGANVDAALVDHPFLVMARSQLKIKSQSGNIPDAIAKVFGIGTLATDSAQRVILATDPKTGAIVARFLYKRVESVSPDGKENVAITIDAGDKGEIGKIIQRERRRAGLQALLQGELGREVARVVTESTGVIENPTIGHSISIDLQNYKRGLVKIAYELAWYWLGDGFLADPKAEKLRQSILQGIPITPDELVNGPHGSVTFGANQAPFPVWDAEPNALVGLLMRVEGSLCVGIRVFSSMSGIIGVSKSPELYPNVQDKDGHFIAIDPVTGTRRESTLAEETWRVVRTDPNAVAYVNRNWV